MIGIIYYAYGAPTSIDGVSEYFSHILKGKPVPKPMLDKIEESFLKPGFPDFIASASQRIASGIEILLNERLDEDVKAYAAYKHTAPFVMDVVKQAISDGVTTIITLPINPIHSASGGGSVHTEVAELINDTNIKQIALKEWHLNDSIVDVYADRVRRAMNWLPKAAQQDAHLLFTVHSQPVDEERNAPYVQQYSELANAIATRVGIVNYHLTYRSANGKANWLAPDVKDQIRVLQESGATGIVTAELLSLAADVESYTEIGAECQAVCEKLQLPFAVSEFPGDSFDAVNALANLVQSSL